MLLCCLSPGVDPWLPASLDDEDHEEDDKDDEDDEDGDSDDASHQELILGLLQVLSSQARVKFLLSLRVQILVGRNSNKVLDYNG